MNADLELDCRSKRCPLPIIELAAHLDQVAVGGVIALLADDPAARHDVPAWCRMRGQEYLGESADEPGPRYLIRRLD